jgi:Ni,Fe-hydrogenase III component G
MTLRPELQAVQDGLTLRFGARIERSRAWQRDELYIHAGPELAGELHTALRDHHGGRLAGVFAEDARAESEVYFVYYLFALDAAHGFVLVRVPVPGEQPEIASLTGAAHAVNWQEREIQDLFGIKMIGHPNPRRCVLHDDWPDVHPLRKDFELRTALPPFAGPRHQFREVVGEGVFQVPVGPVHAGIIEPGHFLFSVAGEPVLYLQLRMFYVHKGIEKLFESLPVPKGVCLAESISGDSSFAHATAFCHAVERAAGVDVPRRARAVRTICLELERVYNHVGDIGAICSSRLTCTRCVSRRTCCA